MRKSHETLDDVERRIKEMTPKYSKLPKRIHRILCIFGMHVWQHCLGEQTVYLKCAVCSAEKRKMVG